MMFNRFTREARRCVEAAVEEARTLGHDSVGDEGLLLGVLAAGNGIAAEALNSFGVSLEAAREEAEGVFSGALASIGNSLDEIRRQAGGSFETRGASPRHLPFSPRAKKALEQSLREALRLGDRKITGEHVLLGASHDEHGHSVRLLTSLGVSVEAVENRLEELRRQAPTR
jgi:ATP-dependent Clp protease ATP-binding subunit ClpC